MPKEKREVVIAIAVMYSDIDYVLILAFFVI